ncbi:MAG: sigma-E processing peptidase SpoIIGA [Oscillospiraceae bacterium]
MIIYADVLIAVNLYINYFLVRGTALLLRRKIKPLRCLLASVVGACGALAIMLPELHPVISVLLKVLLGVAVTFVAFGRQKRGEFLLALLCFLAVSFTFAGGMMALWSFAAPLGMYYRNGFAYFDIPIGAAAVITGAVYGLFRLVKLLRDKNRPLPHEKVLVRRNGLEIPLDGLADTGNALRDSFTGKPVVIAALDKVRSVLPEAVLNYLAGNMEDLEGIRLVPCRTVTAEGVIPAFPAEIIIGGKPVDALLGVTRQKMTGADCIFNPNII